MICVTFISSQAALLGYRIEGHALGKNGKNNIICAAVSSAAYMAANTLTEIVKIKPKVKAQEGFMELVVPDTDSNKANPILAGLELHLTQLSKQYPKNIKISYTEVT